MINPCGEIPLGEKTYVLPWMQVMLMNYIRCKNGMNRYTIDEIKELERELNAQDIQVSVEDTRETRDCSP